MATFDEEVMAHTCHATSCNVPVPREMFYSEVNQKFFEAEKRIAELEADLKSKVDDLREIQKLEAQNHSELENEREAHGRIEARWEEMNKRQQERIAALEAEQRQHWDAEHLGHSPESYAALRERIAALEKVLRILLADYDACDAPPYPTLPDQLNNTDHWEAARAALSIIEPMKTGPGTP